MLLLVPSAMQEDLCEGSLTFTEKEHYKRNIIGIPSTRSFLPEVPMGTDRGGISDLQPNGGQNYPTELTQNLAIRNDLAIPTESQAPSPSMLTPGSGERARPADGGARQASRKSGSGNILQ